MKFRALIFTTVYLFFVALAFYMGLVLRPSHIAFRDRMRGKAVYENPFYSRMVSSHLRQDPLIPTNTVFFLGDSHIQGLCTIGLGVNYGIGSDTTDGLINRIKNYSSLKNASRVFIEIGCNDGETDGLKLAKRILNVVAALPKGPKVYVCSLFPSAGSHLSDNAMKQSANAHLQAFQKDRFIFIDFYSLLADENGALNRLYDSGDGVHLNTKGYQLLINKIAKYIQGVD